MDWSLDRRGSATFQYFSGECAVFDAWRYLRSETLGFSWSRSDGSISLRIDLFGLPFSQSHAPKSFELLSYPFSDHSALVMSSPVPAPSSRGPGRWKLNISILKDDEFRIKVSFLWARWRLQKSIWPLSGAPRNRKHVDSHGNS